MSVLLFCIAEEAKSFTREVLEPKPNQNQGRLFFLVESRDGPRNGEDSGFKNELKENESFESDFIGASPEDCQKWAREEMWPRYNFIQDSLIAIVDARSVIDGTILMQRFEEKLEDVGPIDFGDFGVLPKKEDAWYDFRIDHRYADELFVDFGFVNIGLVYPIYYGRKEELTDERGVFDSVKAARLVAGEKPASFGLAEKDPRPRVEQ